MRNGKDHAGDNDQDPLFPRQKTKSLQKISSEQVILLRWFEWV